MKNEWFCRHRRGVCNCNTAVFSCCTNFRYEAFMIVVTFPERRVDGSVKVWRADDRKRLTEGAGLTVSHWRWRSRAERRSTCESKQLIEELEIIVKGSKWKAKTPVEISVAVTRHVENANQLRYRASWPPCYLEGEEIKNNKEFMEAPGIVCLWWATPCWELHVLV